MTLMLADKMKRLWHTRQVDAEWERLRRMPRYTPTVTDVLGPPLELVDAASFLYMHQEILERQIYRFRCARPDPLIIDGGANIGLSIIYFKRLFPQARIIAFEPDPTLFATLTRNMAAFGHPDVRLLPLALWNQHTTLEFESEGADAGRMVAMQEGSRRLTVSAVPLGDYLCDPVDMLKLDIEGAETEVVMSCAARLAAVRHLFVEYHSFSSQPQTLHTLLDIFHRHGFRVHIQTPLVSPQPYWARREHLGMDMQLNLFGYRQEA
ncbi:MAG: FkbM family methyltransferase [Phycisphaeraceae bacterium]|nr:FkbM family methyltransferase [Phycisphaeraceae bacterium]